ncbi:MAG: thiamine phosphate synthase [bacterium]|nr:thiamine phosphate synthase [bacterium]
MKRVPRLMAIRGLDSTGELSRWAAQLARAGVDGIQIRDRTASDRSIFEHCSSVMAALAALDELDQLPGATSLLVNRRPDIAAAVGAAGVHLPARGLPIRAVRKAFGEDFLIGRSTHSPGEVAEAARDGADYVVFGPVYSTPEKLRFGPPRGLAELAQACAVGIPVLAIGGIDRERLAEVASAGAWGAAAIRMFDRPEEATELVEVAMRQFAPAAHSETVPNA